MALFDELRNILGPSHSDDDINGVINDVKKDHPDAPDSDIVSAVSELAPAAKAGTLDKAVSNSYVNSKYGLDQRKALTDQIAQENQGPNYAAGLAALGAGLAGGNAAAAGQNFLASRRADQNQRVNNFDEMASLEQKDLGNKRAEALATQENDPNSDASKIAQTVALKMGLDPNLASRLTAAKFKALSPALEQSYKVESDRLARADTAKARLDAARYASEDRQDRQADKLSNQENKLTTPFGLANSEEDAKKLKDAAESKFNFDNKIEQMIALREKHNGGSFLDREDVERGKQLSKDLLLEYKNMAKLGVLSKTDEHIINAIIPEDPLKYNSPLDVIQGQDPTLSRLKSFKADSDADFTNRVATRVRPGQQKQPMMGNTAPPAPTGPKAGSVEDGYRFKGGDPKDPKNWEAVAGMEDPNQMLARGGQ